MAARLSDRLVATGMIPTATVRAAVARQAVYGGALDTALLELDAIDEGALWRELAAATELGIPDRALCEAPQKLVTSDASGALALDDAWSVRSRAVPVGVKDGTLQILCGEPVARAEIEGATRALPIPFSLCVAPEIWIAAVQQAIYGRPMEPRLVRLFARVVGAQPVRRWQAANTPAPPPTPPEPPVEIPPRILPSTAPPPSHGEPATVPLGPRAGREGPAPAPPASRAGHAEPAPASLGPRDGRTEPAPASPVPEARRLEPGAGPLPQHDKGEVPGLIERLERGSDVEVAHEALVAITKQDFGTEAKRWASWWKEHEDDDRIEWLFEGLSHKTPEIRAAAEQELRALTGEYFGYAFDLPREAREASRARWQAWWTERLLRRSE